MLYSAWACGDAQARELVVTKPAIVLRARQQTRPHESPDKTPVRKLLDDFGILVGTSRRARQKLASGLLGQLLPTEMLETQHAARQARWACQVLFNSVATLLDPASDAPVPQDSPTATTGVLPCSMSISAAPFSS